MTITPIRMVNLTAASVLVQNVMAALHADITANSTWTITHQTPVTLGPNGSFSMTLRSPSGGIELNLLNAGTPGTPSATTVFLGINPDGSADPITDSTQPWLSAANFSGVDGGLTVAATPGHTEFTWIEWADGAMALFKNATRTFYPYGWHWGTILQPAIGAIANSGNLRMDGHSIMPNLPRYSSTIESWAGNAGTRQRRRIALGQSVDTAQGRSGSWSQPATQSVNMAVRAASNGDPAYLYGPLAERVVWPFVFGHINVTSNSDQGWMTKYLRNVPNTLPPGSIWQVSAQDQYLVIGTDTSLSHLAVPMINGFSPTP